MKTNNTIQSLWIGTELSTIERLAISSFLYHGHEFHLYAYDDVKYVPAGAILKDANDILPRSQIFTYVGGEGYGGFADWFRYALLYKHGGYWVDTDVVCLKPFDFMDELVLGLEKDGYIGNAILGSQRGSSVVKQLLNLAESPNRFMPYDGKRLKLQKIKRFLIGNQRSNIEFTETGPRALTKLLHHLGMMEVAKPYCYFYPIHYTRLQTVFDTSLKYSLDFFANSYSIHLWNELISRENLDKDATYSKDSLIEILKRKYLS